MLGEMYLSFMELFLLLDRFRKEYSLQFSVSSRIGVFI